MREVINLSCTEEVLVRDRLHDIELEEGDGPFEESLFEQAHLIRLFAVSDFLPDWEHLDACKHDKLHALEITDLDSVNDAANRICDDYAQNEEVEKRHDTEECAHVRDICLEIG